MSYSKTLIDNRNFEQHAIAIINAIKASDFVGLDVETQDSNRHEGLNQLCKYREDGSKPSNSKQVFDMNRTVMTGFSLHPENHDAAYYINLNQADIANRLPWEKARLLLDALQPNSYWICHNASYELTAFALCYNYALPRYICTLQMAVSAFGPDEYPIDMFYGASIGPMKPMLNRILDLSWSYDPESGNMPADLQEVVGKITAKESTAAHSYNGFVGQFSYSYGLKALTYRFFGHKMITFDEVVGERIHMGNLTGEDVVAYGCEDAYWAVRLFRHLMAYMQKHCPDTVGTFFGQENPMVQVFSEIWQDGMRVNTAAIFERRDAERAEMARILRELKATIRNLLPFADEPHTEMLAENWYAKGAAKYRQLLTGWALSPDNDDDYVQCQQVRGPVSNAWAAERGDGESTGPNLAHYMPVRVLVYDLLATKLIRSEGSVQSDGEARGKLRDRFLREGNAKGVALIEALNRIAGVEQRMKLYLTPYTLLMDPETGRLYPTVSSMLASRRMAASNPNPMQLAKRGESTYVRGFFLADYDDHVIISIDWSSIELVEIGEMSGDPEFLKAYSQIPHDDLHGGSAADILSVEVPGLNEDIFKALKRAESKDSFLEQYGEQIENHDRLFINLKGEELTGDKAYKYWRTEIGKGANFNYWYSGFLATVGERMGWSMDKTQVATERYRQRFPVAEQWRVGLIEEGSRNGFITLPDGHRRVRWEATLQWMSQFLDKVQYRDVRDDERARRYNTVMSYIARKIQRRAHNQLVNSEIQGTCATIAKRSVLRIRDKMKAVGWGKREARFMIPIHDELVYSVHRKIVPEFIHLARGTMIDHPDLFKLCKLDASPSVGLTFEPWNKKARLGQIELFEPPAEIVGAEWENKRLPDDGVRAVVDWLFDNQKRIAA